MTRPNPTIEDVAREAGVSKATVSAVLNDTAPVRDATRSRVQSVIERLQYRPRNSTHRVRLRKRKVIAAVIKEIDNPFFGDVVTGAEREARRRGYSILIANSESDFAREREVVDVLREKDVDGLIIDPVLDHTTDLEHFFHLRRRNFPFVLLQDIQGVPVNVVDVANIDAMREAVLHLIASGRDRVTHFAGPANSMHTHQRAEGLRRAYSECALVYRDSMIVPAGAHMIDGYTAAKARFSNADPAQRPNGVTCFNDMVAIGVARALTELGLRVPDDVSIVGFDNIDTLDYLSTPISSIAVPREEMGEIAARMLIDQLESSQPVSPQKVLLEGRLVLRG
ncbi:MAG: LacI family DNA-binding transcriptional regulator [Gemmatimonadaceae bacterium]